MPVASAVGVRELRNNVAAVLRRAESGDRVIVTVDGQPVAQLSPLSPTTAPTLEDLAAAGLIEPPGRKDKPEPPDPAFLPVDVSATRVVEEVRG